MDQTTSYDPVLGAAALGQFQRAPLGQLAYLSGTHLREGLLASLYTAEMLAATAGVVPWFDLGGGQRGVAVLGAARAKIDQAPPGVRTLYLAAHGAARDAQAHAREANQDLPLATRTDGELAVVTEAISIAPLLVVVTVLGVAAIVAGAWFAKGAVERMVQTRSDDIRASYAIDSASKLAMAQIASGQPVSDSVFSVFSHASDRESGAETMATLYLVGGCVCLAAGAYLAIGSRPSRRT